jgi:Recombination endonuclease VII
MVPDILSEDLGPKKKRNGRPRSTHCRRGHEYNETNTCFHPCGTRTCRVCENLRSQARVRSGLCVHCGQPAVEGRVRCTKHLEQSKRQAARKRVRHPDLSREVSVRSRARRDALGQCRNCSEPALPRKKYCSRHLRMNRDKATKAAYRLTDEELGIIRAATHCDLCGGKFEGSGHAPLAPNIDHDHATGKRRGVIHHRCNIGLGMFEDNLKMTEMAVAYLRRSAEGG